MSTVLVYTSPSRGHLYPIMGIALSLAHRGHTVNIRTLSSEIGTVERAGLPAQPIAKASEERVIDDWSARSQLESTKRALQTFVDRAALEVDDIRKAIDDVHPDLILVDTNAWGAQAVCEAHGQPWATWHPYPMPYPSRDAPPFGPGLMPARGLIGRLRDRALAPVVFGLMQRFLPQLNVVRAHAGASLLGHITELYLQPPLLLHMTAEPFEYPRRDWPKNFALVGPGLWSPSTVSMPAWLTSSTKPIVLVTCSSEFQDDGALIDVATEAFGTDESVHLVCTTAGTDPARFRVPASVVVERFVPHTLVLPRACTVVCHGGMGITQRALAAGVPPCVVPWGRDQLEVARRVVQSRAGALVPRAKLSKVRLRAAVEEARRNAGGAAGVAAAFARAGGTDRAVALLEGLLVSAGPDHGRTSDAVKVV
jgi:MGT family glycosyltransferase